TRCLSDSSSDVCSSDLMVRIVWKQHRKDRDRPGRVVQLIPQTPTERLSIEQHLRFGPRPLHDPTVSGDLQTGLQQRGKRRGALKIGRASCREREESWGG